ncbi:MAG: two-component regulator propeller domain-containing protein [Verrucomicrobiota bacterium]
MSPRSGLAVVCLLACRVAAVCVGNTERDDAPALTNYFVRSWQVDEGLPYSTVNRLVQDGKGYLWAGTMGGLARFDGVNFKLFTSPLVASVAARNIRALAKEADSTLLLLPAVGGVVRWKDGVFSPHPMSEAMAGKQLEYLFVEPTGAVWVCPADKSFVRWEAGRIAVFTNTISPGRGSKPSFAMDAEGRAWVARDNFLGWFDGRELVRFPEQPGAPVYLARSGSGGIWVCGGNELSHLKGGRLYAVSTNLPWTAMGGKVLDVFEDSRGAVWIGTASHGLFRFLDGEFARVDTSHGGINAIMEDHEGSMWVATEGGGINRLRQRIFSNYDSKAGLRDDVSDAVCEDAQGNVWLGNRNGGLARIQRGRVTLAPLFEGRVRLGVNSVCADDAGNIWASTAVGLYRCTIGEPPVAKKMDARMTAVHVLFKSRNGDIWVGADPDIFGRFRGDEFQSVGEGLKRVRTIAEDASGAIWAGTDSGQLFRLAGEQWTRFTEADGLPKAPIQCLYVDGDGLMWMGTVGGLYLWRGERFFRFTPEDGLTDDVIYQILEDDDGRLWFGSRRGIFHMAKQELLGFAEGRVARLNSVSFGSSEGLHGVYCFGSCQPMAWKGRDGRLWFATKQGVLAVEPGALQRNAQPPPVFVDECLVNDRAVALAESIEVPPGRRKLEFRFTALSYAAPEKVRVRHQLEGVDEGWVETGGQRSAIYSGLAPGNYRLRVTACNNDGVWNERGATLAFIVLPAWWQTWWFQSAWLAAFAVAVALSARYWSHRRLRLKLERLEQEHALEKERSRIARDLHDGLGASLTQIGLLADMARRESLPAEELREQSAQLAGRTREMARELDAIVWTVNPGNDTLENLVTYVCQVSQELFRLTPIRCRLDVAEDIPPCSLTPEARHALFLVAREAMNNVIKHSRATEVWLRTRARAGVFELMLEDNGQGFDVEAAMRSGRNGLRNMRTRLEELGGEFAVRSGQGKGATVSLRFPLK